jgi:hypothetical protein
MQERKNVAMVIAPTFLKAEEKKSAMAEDLFRAHPPNTAGGMPHESCIKQVPLRGELDGSGLGVHYSCVSREICKQGNVCTTAILGFA